MRKKNGFVLAETLIVVLLLSITLMSLYSSFSYTLTKSRSKSTEDTIGSLYQTYYLKDYLDNLYYNSSLSNNAYDDSFLYYAFEYGASSNTCKFYLYDGYLDDNPNRGNTYLIACDYSRVNSNDPLASLVRTYSIDKIYYINYGQINDLNETLLLNKLDASAINYVRGQDFNLTNNQLVVKYLKEYNYPSDYDTNNLNLLIDKEVYYSSITLESAARANKTSPIYFYDMPGSGESPMISSGTYANGDKLILDSNHNFTNHGGQIIIAWTNSEEIASLSLDEISSIEVGSDTYNEYVNKGYEYYNVNSEMEVHDNNRKLYAIWCGNGSLEDAVSCSQFSNTDKTGVAHNVDGRGVYDGRNNYTYYGTKDNNNFVIIGDYCYRMMSTFSSTEGIKSIYYGRSTDEGCYLNEGINNSTYAFNTQRKVSNFFNSYAWMYKDISLSYAYGSADNFGVDKGLETHHSEEIASGRILSLNTQVYVGDNVIYNNGKYTLVDKDNKKVTNKTMYNSYDTTSYESIQKFVGKYFCYGGKYNECSKVYYLYFSGYKTETKKYINEYYGYENGMNRDIFTSTKMAFSNDVTYKNGKYYLNTSDMYYPTIDEFFQSSASVRNGLTAHHFACSDVLKRADGDEYACDEAHLIIHNGKEGYRGRYFVLRDGRKTIKDVFDYVNGTNYSERTNSSPVKQVVDTFYENNVKKYESLIDKKATFCNNVYLGKKGDFSNEVIEYNSVNYKVNDNSNNSYIFRYNNFADGESMDYSICVPNQTAEINKSYLYSTSDNPNGNGLLTYPIALLSSNEAYYVGIRNYYNNHYLLSNFTYPTMSPTYTQSATEFAFGIYYTNTSCSNEFPSEGRLCRKAISDSGAYAIKPVISIKLNNRVVSGNGSATAPYRFN